MEIILNLIQITIITVILIDISGFIDTIKTLIKKWLKTTKDISIKPFDCSFCMNHHISLLYLLITHNLSITNYLIILIMSVLTPVIMTLIILIRETIINLLSKMDL